MKRFLLSLAVLAFAAPSASASFLVDDFEEPATGAHNSDGSTVALPTPPNFFAERTMDGSATSNLSVNSGGLAAAIQANESAWIEWTVPSEDAPFADLEFVNFNGTALINSTYDITLNGVSISGGPQTFDSGYFSTNGAMPSLTAGDELRLTFSVGAGGLAVFQADAIQANPEPASALLLGGLMFGGLCRFRRRRHAVC